MSLIDPWQTLLAECDVMKKAPAKPAMTEM